MWCVWNRILIIEEKNAKQNVKIKINQWQSKVIKTDRLSRSCAPSHWILFLCFWPTQFLWCKRVKQHLNVKKSRRKFLSKIDFSSFTADLRVCLCLFVVYFKSIAIAAAQLSYDSNALSSINWNLIHIINDQLNWIKTIRINQTRMKQRCP